MFVIYLGKKVKLGPDSALYQIPEIDIKNKTRELQGIGRASCRERV